MDSNGNKSQYKQNNSDVENQNDTSNKLDQKPTSQSRIKLLQKCLFENTTNLNQPNERAEREKELKELATYRLVNFDEDNNNDCQSINEISTDVMCEPAENSELVSSDFPSIPSDETKIGKYMDDDDDDKMDCKCRDDTILSSEWRDETIINSSTNEHYDIELLSTSSHKKFDNYEDSMDVEPLSLHDISIEKLQSLDRTMDCLEELDLIPKKSSHSPKITQISCITVNSEPASPTKLDTSRRDRSYNKYSMDSPSFIINNRIMDDSFSPSIKIDNNTKNLMKTSTKFIPNSTINNEKINVVNKQLFSDVSGIKGNKMGLGQNNETSFNRNITTTKISSPIGSTPLNRKDQFCSVDMPHKINKVYKTSVKDKHVDLFKPINSSINDSDSYNSRFEVSRIEDLKQYHVKRRSLSATQTRGATAIPMLKLKSTTTTTTNHSIGFNPSLNSYDHPDDVSRNLSFSTFESVCSLHNKNAKDILIKKYYAAAKVQQQIISQSENVLNLIYTKHGKINDSARLPCCLDAESLFLLSTYRRNLFLHKASKLKRGNVSCKCDPENNKIATASVSISEIYIQINESFTNSLKYSQPSSYYYFMAIITFGDSDVVFCTTPISIYDLNSKNLLLLPGEFSNAQMRCDESINVEIYARKLSNKKETHKINDILRIRFRKRNITSSNNSTDWKNRECAFKFVGSCAIPITEKNTELLSLFNRATDIPLGSRFSVKLCLQPNYESYAQGFLSLYKMEGGLPIWQRYWCVLQKSNLKMWNWRDDDPNDCIISIDLNWDTNTFCKILPQHICARSNTIEITLQNKTCNEGNNASEFIGKPMLSLSSSSNNYSIWLSADNTNECKNWLNALTLHLTRYKDWVRVISSRRPSVPSRRLV